MKIPGKEAIPIPTMWKYITVTNSSVLAKSLIEWKQAPPIKNTHANNETKNLDILTSDYINTTRAATNYLDQTPVTIYNDIKNVWLYNN